MIVINNDLVNGTSGRIGDQLVYRQRGEKTVIAKRPKPKSKPDTELQIATRELFHEAVLYAKTVISDPLKKALYQAKAKGYQSAYNLAVSDFCKAPEIKSCDLLAYSGAVGEQIKVRAIDDFKVDWVRMQVRDAADSLLEEGAAVLAENGVDWIYTTTVVNHNLPGTSFSVTAADMPGNFCRKEFVI